jgi:hypothetical protein
MVMQVCGLLWDGGQRPLLDLAYTLVRRPVWFAGVLRTNDVQVAALVTAVIGERTLKLVLSLSYSYSSSLYTYLS